MPHSIKTLVSSVRFFYCLSLSFCCWFLLWRCFYLILAQCIHNRAALSLSRDLCIYVFMCGRSLDLLSSFSFSPLFHSALGIFAGHFLLIFFPPYISRVCKTLLRAFLFLYISATLSCNSILTTSLLLCCLFYFVIICAQKLQTDNEVTPY